MNRPLYIVIVIFLISSCTHQPEQKDSSKKVNKIPLTLVEANRLATLPLGCIQSPYPYKPGHIIERESDVGLPIDHHPAFYGCFDWHSAVHGHWSLVYLLKTFPDLDQSESGIKIIDENITAQNIEKEVAYFTMNKQLKSFERTYGWAWILKLQEELITWDNENAKKWSQNLQPLVDYIRNEYIAYLPKLVYPIRVGEHSNTAFGLSFAYDYATTSKDSIFINAIEEAAKRFYLNDTNCPIDWEPSGYDFLSPCLQEMDIMRKVLSEEEFNKWFPKFLPNLTNGTLTLEPGQIRDRSDGKLVHLDGLNFSRAWCLFPLAENSYAQEIAHNHLKYSLEKITDGDYAGQHWLASFALYAFKTMN